MLVEAFVCRRCVNIVVRADSELEPTAVLRCYLDRDSDDLWPEQERILSNIIINKKVGLLTKLKYKVYKTVIKPTIEYGAECWAVRKKDENRSHVAEIRMLR